MIFTDLSVELFAASDWHSCWKSYIFFSGLHQTIISVWDWTVYRQSSWDLDRNMTLIVCSLIIYGTLWDICVNVLVCVKSNMYFLQPMVTGESGLRGVSAHCRVAVVHDLVRENVTRQHLQLAAGSARVPMYRLITATKKTVQVRTKCSSYVCPMNFRSRRLYWKCSANAPAITLWWWKLEVIIKKTVVEI